ncbi:autotransporter-associated beta strand repeat-containing protein [Bilophila wadsworthia]
MTHRFRFTCTRLLPACALAARLVGPPGFAPSANAADVTYPGSNLDKGPLWNIDNSLFPAGSLSDNVVTINSGNVGGDVYGNDVDAAFSPVSNNTVILSGGSVGGDILGGANNGAVTDNNVSISGFGSVLGSVYGGYGAAEGTVNGNDVSIFDSGSVTGNVLGGYSRSVNSHVIGNTVTISGGTVRDIYGGQSGKGNALNNSVTLDGAASQANVIYGGRVEQGTARENAVVMKNGSVTLGIFGGIATADGGQAQDNHVTMSGGAVGEHLIGGYVQNGSGAATGNSVIFNGGSVTENVYGGRSVNGPAQNNSVTMTNGSAKWLLGGYSNSGDASGNRVEVSGGTLSGGVNGGETTSGNATGNSVDFSNVTATYVQGGYSGSGSATGNSLALHSGTVQNNAFGGYVDSGSGEASDNSVTFNGGSVTNNIYGGMSAAGLAQNNSVTMTNGSAKWLLGGYSANGNVIGNSVNISGGTLTGVSGGESNSGSATGNIVSISGGTVQSNVNGGFVASGSGKATGNIVNISGNADLSTATVAGGISSSDAFTGNTLNKNSDAAVHIARNFASVNFGYSGNANIGELDSTPTGSALSGVTVNTNANNVSFDGVISGSGSITKTGAGTLILSGTNTYSGGTTISAGTLKGNIASGTDLSIADSAIYDGDNKARSVGGLNGAGKILNTNGLTVQSGDFAGIIDNSNTSLLKNGAGTLTLTGNNAYTGSTTISEGTLKGSIASGTDLSIAASAIYDGDNKARSVGGLNGGGKILNTDGLTVQSGDFAGIIDNSNTSLTKTGAGTLTLTGNNAYTGSTTISDGTLKGNIASGTDLSIADSATYDGDNKARSVGGLNGDGKILNTDGLTVQNGTFGGVIDNSNTSLTKTGAGTLTLTRNNAYTGGTTISEGTLKGNIASGTDLSIVDNATYDGDNKARSVGGLNGGGNILNTDGLTVQSGTFGGVIGNSNTSLIKTGAGTLTLTGTNAYTGGTTISEGTLKGNIASGTDLSIADSATYDGANKARSVGGLNGGGKILNTNGLTVQSGDFAGIIDNSNTSLLKTGAGTLTLSGTNTYTGMTTVRSGTLALGSDLTSNQLTLYGGTVFDRGSHNHSLDNGILSVNGANGQSSMYKGDLSARNATLNFISPVHPTQPLLRVTGDADVSGSACNVGLAGGTSLASGSTLTLLEVDPDKTLTANNLQRGNGIVQIGSTVAHDITADVNLDPTTRRLNAVTAQVSPGRATDQSKALSEGFLGGLALNLQGADLVAGRGMDSAVRASSGTDDAERHGFAGFGALSGGSLRYNTGSHLDMNSLSLLTGLSWGIDLAPGRLTLGAFFEYGNGSYDTHNSFTNAASVDGDGNAYYLGGGILARMDFVNIGPGRFYAEASGRAGKTHNEYDSSDLRDAAGRKADYDSSSPYYGLHFGTGYVWNINDAATLDLYGKYFWTRQQGDSVGLSTGEHLSFDDINSSRLRFGGRFAYILNEHVAPYIGAAWEHEFDGKARATTNGFDIDAPNLHGNTGIGELGISLTPSADLPLTVDLGVQGYTGKREGVTGSLMVKWEF